MAGTEERATPADVANAAVEQLLAEHPPATTDAVEFLRAQFDAGLAYVWFPLGLGGLDLPPTAQRLVDDRLAAAGAPPNGRVTNAAAAGQGAASILAFGSEDQKRRFLRPLFTAELVGCQLYSERGSGSDLASLTTRAERDGDDWVVNGRKMSASGAHRADVALLLARTDPDVPKQAGLTQFVVDMHAPGIEVWPLRQMTGRVAFDEVLLTDVRVPDSERLGPVNGGWAVSQHTLVVERRDMSRASARGGGPISEVVEAWRARADTTSPAAMALKDQLMRHWVRVEVVRLLRTRAAELRAVDSSGPEGSVGKLAVSLASRRLGEWAPVLLGAAGTLLPEGYEGDGGQRGTARRKVRSLPMTCVGSPAIAIAGGTDDIQRNIIADRTLGLPREPAVDPGAAWSKTLHN